MGYKVCKDMSIQRSQKVRWTNSNQKDKSRQLSLGYSKKSSGTVGQTPLRTKKEMDKQ